MDYTEFSKLCLSSERIKDLNEKQKKQLAKEIESSSIFFKNGRDLYEELKNRKEEIDNSYIIPYILGLTKETTQGVIRKVQIKPGSSGGIDIDNDFESVGRERILAYLKNKYGDDKVLNVGTFSSLGPSSAAKDLLKVYGIDFSSSNEFTKVLEKAETWDQNITRVKTEHPQQYNFYLKNKEILDLVPSFLNKIRQGGKHSGGVVILPKAVHNYIPVDRINGVLATSFPESGAETVLDELGIIKMDLLSISILDVIKASVEMCEEKLFEIEEDGMIKIVPESYLNDKEIEGGK